MRVGALFLCRGFRRCTWGWVGFLFCVGVVGRLLWGFVIVILKCNRNVSLS